MPQPSDLAQVETLSASELIQQLGMERAMAALRSADEQGSQQAAVKLGDLLWARNKPEAAAEAYRRAEQRGSVRGSMHLGCVLEQLRDLAGAEAAYRRADQGGDGEAASNLGVLLYERGDTTEAEACLRRADERGSLTGTFRLGVLLQARGDLPLAEAAYRRGAELGSCFAALNLGNLLDKRGEVAGACAAFERAENLGIQSADPRERNAASSARHRMNALRGERVRPMPPPGFDSNQAALDSVLWMAGDPSDPRVRQARENAFRIAMDKLEPSALPSVAQLFAELGEEKMAEAILRRGVASGARLVGPSERGRAHDIFLVGSALDQNGDVEGARGAFMTCISLHDPEWSPRAAYTLGELLWQRGDGEAAEPVLRLAIAAEHLDWSAAAGVTLGVVLAARGDHGESWVRPREC